MEQILVEKTASRGIAAAKVYKYQEPDLTPDTYTIAEEETAKEQKKMRSLPHTLRLQGTLPCRKVWTQKSQRERMPRHQCRRPLKNSRLFSLRWMMRT